MTANARVEVGKPGRGVTSDVVEYEGAEKRLSLTEDLEGRLLLNVGVTTTEKNTTERRPNYRIDIQIPVDVLVARFLRSALERAEEVDLTAPGLGFTSDELEEAHRRFVESGADLTPYMRAGGAPLDLGIDSLEPELTEVDGEVITFGEVRDFREVVPGPGGGIRESEVEAFRRFRNAPTAEPVEDFVEERLAEAEAYAGDTREHPDLVRPDPVTETGERNV